jgi:phosphate starvation-inducible PhoH-like protein
VRRQIEVSNDVAAALAGSGDEMLRALESQLSCAVFLRGNLVTLDGEAEAVASAAAVVQELATLTGQGHAVGADTVRASSTPSITPSRRPDVLDDVIWRHRSTAVAPKTVNQKAYVDAIRRSTVTFGVGPPARARPSWPSPWPPRRSPGARSTASSSPAPRSRRASAWASCPAT